MDTGVETWKIRLEKFQLSFYTSVYIDENAKQELIFDLLQVIFILFFYCFSCSYIKFIQLYGGI